MQIGVPKEIKVHEYRVGMIPASVREAVHHGHRVMIETGAGAGVGFEDDAYLAAGAEIHHIRGDGSVESEQELARRSDDPQLDLFGSE